MPPRVRTAGGPFGRGSYRLTWNGRKVIQQVNDAMAAMAYGLQRDILTWLYTNLHRWTGQMAREAFCEVYFTGGGRLVIRFGSDAEHTIWHELRWHPQLRECADIWIPEVLPRLKAAMAKVS